MLSNCTHILCYPAEAAHTLTLSYPAVVDVHIQYNMYVRQQTSKLHTHTELPSCC